VTSAGTSDVAYTLSMRMINILAETVP